MDSNTTVLKNYIITQRGNGISDEIIYNTLLAAGWQHDMLVQALESRTEDSNESVEVSEVSYPSFAATPVVVASQSADFQQQPVAQIDSSDKLRKKLSFIGKATIALGVLGLVAGLYPEMSVIFLVFAIAQIVIGFGILGYNKLAYTLFNILAILAILSGVFILLSLPLALMLILVDPSVSSIALAVMTTLLSVGQLVLYIYGGIVFHKKETRLLFQKKRREV
jgi:hypothetical protein